MYIARRAIPSNCRRSNGMSSGWERGSGQEVWDGMGHNSTWLEKDPEEICKTKLFLNCSFKEIFIAFYVLHTKKNIVKLCTKS